MPDTIATTVPEQREDLAQAPPQTASHPPVTSSKPRSPYWQDEKRNPHLGRARECWFGGEHRW
jgi:hypothetical protein